MLTILRWRQMGIHLRETSWRKRALRFMGTGSWVWPWLEWVFMPGRASCSPRPSAGFRRGTNFGFRACLAASWPAIRFVGNALGGEDTALYPDTRARWDTASYQGRAGVSSRRHARHPTKE